MKRSNFLKSIGAVLIGAPLIKEIGLPKDESGFYIDKTPEYIPSKLPYKDMPVTPVNGLNALTIFKDNKVQLYDKEFKVAYEGCTPQKVEWEGTEKKLSNRTAIRFPECTSGTNTISFYGILSESGEMICCGSLVPPLQVMPCVTPEFPIGNLIIKIDD